jgi:hypothetical protein
VSGKFGAPAALFLGVRAASTEVAGCFTQSSGGFEDAKILLHLLEIEPRLLRPLTELSYLNSYFLLQEMKSNGLGRQPGAEP